MSQMKAFADLSRYLSEIGCTVERQDAMFALLQSLRAALAWSPAQYNEALGVLFEVFVEPMVEMSRAHNEGADSRIKTQQTATENLERDNASLRREHRVLCKEKLANQSALTRLTASFGKLHALYARLDVATSLHRVLTERGIGRQPSLGTAADEPAAPAPAPAEEDMEDEDDEHDPSPAAGS